MDNNNHAADEAKGEENFAEMFEKSFKKQGRLEPGQMVEAMIVKITPEWIFLDLGGKGEGYLDRKELADDEGKIGVKEGDTVRAYFTASENNEMHFTTKIGSGPGKQSQIEDAWRNGIPVEGTFVKEMKGGFEVRIGGSVRAFCPFSQTGFRRDENQAGYMGKSLSFKIIEYGENGRNIVLSRRPILDEEKRTRKEELKTTLTEGMKIKGRVTSLQNFGAFVDIGGIEGLLPISEISYSRTEKVSDILSTGQEVEVIIKRLDWDNNKFSFSLKDTLPDPWDRLADAYPVGSYHSGKVSRLAPFGAFVTLKEGIDGLIHISKLGAGRRINHPREVVKEGETVEVKIEAVDQAARKLSLSLAEVSRAAEEEAATIKEYKQQVTGEPQGMGSLGDLLKAKMEQKKK
ncbi:MAG: 30S ribosomal protein S1 [Nitrospirae bacterium GWD2_57_9]|nr:MAG: 30S ribosomal protein S1 [Nitrospirae bacterium GWD2_57_9]